MSKISEHFERKEFECHCNNDCGFSAVDIELVNMLEQVRTHFDRPLLIHCACRCLEHNKSLGSKDTSQHVKALAADFHVSNIENQDVLDYLIPLMEGRGGLGVYDWGVHLDMREKQARWDSRK